MTDTLAPGGLGRREAVDARDLQFLAADVLTPKPLRTRMHADKYCLNQGNTGTCVTHAVKGLLMSAPCCQDTDVSGLNPFELYCECVKNDEWDDNDNDCDFGLRPYQSGTSVRAAAKALKRRGLIKEYRWAFDAATAIQWIVEHGPVVVGTEWRASMNKPTARGYMDVDLSSPVIGGHAYLILGYNIVYDAVRMMNSWGYSWGRQGRVWIRRQDFDGLLQRRGEALMTLDLVPDAS